MKLRLFLEHRFKRTPDGNVWSPIFSYESWTRYLQVFPEITLCARVMDVPAVGKDVAPATGEGVTLASVPYYHGPQQYLRRRRQVKLAVSSLVAPGDAYIVRVPGNLANLAITTLNAAAVPYAIEAIADPWDMFSPGSSTHPLRTFFRWSFTRSMRQQCASAAVSLYVTEHALQRRYPPKEGPQKVHKSTHAVSDVCLINSAFTATPRRFECFATRSVRLVCVGSFNLLYKAQDVLVKAFARVIERGLDAHLSFVGDGIYRPRVEALATRHSFLQGRVEFLGQLRSGAAVQEVLDRSHLFVLPSRQEGLPRAVLEAMARGLPCIGSDVGGFPEILPSDALVRCNDVESLAECIVKLAGNPARLAEMSRQNLRRATDFHADKLAGRQRAYYTAVHELFTDHWARQNSGTHGGSAGHQIILKAQHAA